MTENEHLDFKEFFDLFPEIFHYTNVSSFIGIFKEQILCAKYYEDLNDRSELGRFRLKVCEFIRPLIRQHFAMKMQRDLQFSKAVNQDGGIDVVVDKEVAMFLDNADQITFGKQAFQPFVCSFCAHSKDSYEAKNGLLSQWRGYATDGGVAVVFDARGIGDRLQHEKEIYAHPINHIGNVIYDNDAEAIRKEFNEVFEHFPKMIDAFYTNRKPALEKIYRHFVGGCTLVKHHGFCEEKEVRIVVAPRPNEDSDFYEPAHGLKPSKTIYHKKRNNREVRYIELFGDAPLPIKRVIIGPSQFQDINYQKITDLVTGLRIEVVKSDTPFLG